MSQLQLALIAIGVVIIAAIIVYNVVQERKALKEIKSARAAFGFDGSDALGSPSVLRTGPRTEPALRAGDRREPSMGAVNSKLWPDSIAVAPARLEPPELALDDETELIVSISFENAIGGDVLAALSSGLARVGTKPVQVGATETQSHRLEPPRAGHQYSGVHYAILLANRQGPLNAVEFSEFMASVQRVASELDVDLDVPDMTETLARANALDERCAAVDAQIALNIVSKEGLWSGSLVAQAAVEAGFSQRADGRFAYMRRNGAELFMLSALDAQNRLLPIGPEASRVSSALLTLVLDVPRAPEVEKPYATLLNIARAISTRLDGVVVDDNRRPIVESQLASIELQLSPMYARLLDAGFEAGTPRTLRLFN